MANTSPIGIPRLMPDQAAPSAVVSPILKSRPSSAAQQSGEYGSDARNNQCNDYSKDFVAISQLSSLPRGTFFPKPDTTPLLSA
jgi:hypothetical protein